MESAKVQGSIKDDLQMLMTWKKNMNKNIKKIEKKNQNGLCFLLQVCQEFQLPSQVAFYRPTEFLIPHLKNLELNHDSNCMP